MIRFTNVPVEVAACPECGGQIQIAMQPDLTDTEPGSYITVIPKGAVACCSLDDGKHRYASDDWEPTRQKLVHWCFE
jgi:hypothetical protein